MHIDLPALADKKIVHVCAWAKALTQFRMPLLQKLQETCQQQVIYCPYQKDHVSKLIAAGFNVTTGEISTKLEPSIFKQTHNLYKFFKKNKFDLLIAHQPMGALISITAGVMAKVPHKIYATGGLKYFPENKSLFNNLIRKGEYTIIKNVDAVLLVNREDERLLKGVNELQQKAYYVGPLGGCGIDTTKFNPEIPRNNRQKARKELGIPDHINVIGYSGRCVWEKGFKEIIDAAAIIHKQRPELPIRFLIFGEGQHLPAIIDYSKRKNVFHLFDFEGYKFNLNYYLSAIDVFILPSHREGLPVSLLEAMAMGLPSIATSIRGCNELIENGFTGLLIPTRKPEELAGTIQKLVDNVEYRTSIGVSAYNKIKNLYDQRVLLPKTLSIINRLAQTTATYE